MYRVGVVIAAGGSGKRFGGRSPKQFHRLQGIPIIQRTVELFSSIRGVDEIVIACPAQFTRRTERLLGGIRLKKLITMVPGGKERQGSVWNALHGFLARPDIVLVHDAARPLVSRRIIGAVIDSVKKHGSGVAGVKLRDTIKLERRPGFYSQTLDRNRLWAVQTPQGFAFELLFKAHKAARRARYLGTDEASLVERLGIPVRIVNGDQSNIKVTTRADLHLAEMWLKLMRD